MSTISIAYLVAPWFLFITLFGERKYLPHAAILFLMAFMNILLVDAFELFDTLSYTESKEVLIRYDGAFAWAVAMFIGKDKLAIKQSALLAFCVACHGMILCDLTMYSSVVSVFFYSWYDELIILTGLLQMAISKDGITSALGRVRELLLLCSFYWWCHTKNMPLYASKKKEARA